MHLVSGTHSQTPVLTARRKVGTRYHWHMLTEDSRTLVVVEWHMRARVVAALAISFPRRETTVAVKINLARDDRPFP